MTDPITQAAADAIVDAVYGEHLPFPPLAIAVVVVAAVTPLIREQIAAEIRDQQYISSPHFNSEDFDIGMTIAAEIARREAEAARIARGGQQ